MREIPQIRRTLIPDCATEICGHLSPILTYLLSNGNVVANRETEWPECALEINLQHPIDLAELESEFDLPDFLVAEEFLSPHDIARERHVVCKICRHIVSSPRPEPDIDLTVLHGEAAEE